MLETEVAQVLVAAIGAGAALAATAGVFYNMGREKVGYMKRGECEKLRSKTDDSLGALHEKVNTANQHIATIAGALSIPLNK